MRSTVSSAVNVNELNASSQAFMSSFDKDPDVINISITAGVLPSNLTEAVRARAAGILRNV